MKTCRSNFVIKYGAIDVLHKLFRQQSICTVAILLIIKGATKFSNFQFIFRGDVHDPSMFCANTYGHKWHGGRVSAFSLLYV